MKYTHIYVYVYIYVYIVIHRQTVSFYQNSSVWLDTQDARGWDWNLSNFTLDCASDHSSTKRTMLAKGILRYFFIFRNSSSSLCLHFFIPSRLLLYFDLRPGPKILFQGNTPEESDTFQRPVIERDRVGGLRLMIWDKVKVPLCHYSHAPEESNLWTAWQLFPLDDD